MESSGVSHSRNLCVNLSFTKWQKKMDEITQSRDNIISLMSRAPSASDNPKTKTVLENSKKERISCDLTLAQKTVKFLAPFHKSEDTRIHIQYIENKLLVGHISYYTDKPIPVKESITLPNSQKIIPSILNNLIKIYTSYSFQWDGNNCYYINQTLTTPTYKLNNDDCTVHEFIKNLLQYTLHCHMTGESLNISFDDSILPPIQTMDLPSVPEKQLSVTSGCFSIPVHSTPEERITKYLIQKVTSAMHPPLMDRIVSQFSQLTTLSTPISATIKTSSQTSIQSCTIQHPSGTDIQVTKICGIDVDINTKTPSSTLQVSAQHALEYCLQNLQYNIFTREDEFSVVESVFPSVNNDSTVKQLLVLPDIESSTSLLSSVLQGR